MELTCNIFSEQNKLVCMYFKVALFFLLNYITKFIKNIFCETIKFPR